MSKKKNKIIAIAGMVGAGKSVVADYFVNKGYQFLRFGQITLDYFIERGLDPTEARQKKFREGVRKKYGMGAYALLIIPKIQKIINNGPVVLDGLYSWDEYKILKNKYGKLFTLIAVWAPPELRYKRVSKRRPDKKDKKMRQHHFTKREAKARDYAEIENSDKGGPIAMADYMITNESSMKMLKERIKKIYYQINKT